MTFLFFKLNIFIQRKRYVNINVHVQMNEVLSLSTLGNCVGSMEKISIIYYLPKYCS